MRSRDDVLEPKSGKVSEFVGERRRRVEHDSDVVDRAMRKHVRFRMDELLVRLEPYFNLNSKHLTNAINGGVQRK